MGIVIGKHQECGCKNPGLCPYILMCKSYLERSWITDCRDSRQIFDKAVKEILQKHEIDTEGNVHEVLAAITKGGDSKNIGYDVAKDSSSGKSICYYYLRGMCRWNFNCRNVHCELPYQWRWKRYFEKHWNILSETDNEKIESAFCIPDNQSYNLDTIHGVKIAIDFKTKTGKYGSWESCVIHRLSTQSSEESINQPWSTVWLWFWKNPKGKWIKYGDEDTCTGFKAQIYSTGLEQAFIANPIGEIRFRTVGKDSHDYILNFQKMVQRNLRFGTEREVCRRPSFIGKETFEWKMKSPLANVVQVDGRYGTATAPEHWTISNRALVVNHFQLVKIENIDADYSRKESLFHASLPKSTASIRSIRRIENGDLWENFVSKRTKMLKKMGEETIGERELFHGTLNQYIDPICRQGFDFRLSGRSLYGKGSYFATNAKYSNDYAEQSKERAMFLVKVLPGAYVLGSSEYKRPPQKDKNNPCSELYDSCVDDETKPEIFVIFDNNQIYPEYLIKYRYSLYRH